MAAANAGHWWRFFGEDTHPAQWGETPPSSAHYQKIALYKDDALRSGILDILEQCLSEASTSQRSFIPLVESILGCPGHKPSSDNHRAYLILATSQSSLGSAIPDSINTFNAMILYYGKIAGCHEDELDDLLATSLGVVSQMQQGPR